MNTLSQASARRPLPAKMADLRGLALLGLDGVVGVTNVVEASLDGRVVVADH
jgi:hypothetical protein